MKARDPRWVLIAATGAWCGTILLAPALESQTLYALFSELCHQNPERSWVLAGRPLAVCIRCFSIYSGFLLALNFQIRPSVPAMRGALTLSLLEVIVAHLWLDLAVARSISALLLGLSGAGFVVRGIHEMLSNRITFPRWRLDTRFANKGSH